MAAAAATTTTMTTAPTGPRGQPPSPPSRRACRCDCTASRRQAVPAAASVDGHGAVAAAAPLSPSRKRTAQHINIAAGSPSAARRTAVAVVGRRARKAARRGTDDLSEGDENAVADDELGIETFVLR